MTSKRFHNALRALTIIFLTVIVAFVAVEAIKIVSK